jgi:hypothetical protein
MYIHSTPRFLYVLIVALTSLNTVNSDGGDAHRPSPRNGGNGERSFLGILSLFLWVGVQNPNSKYKRSKFRCLYLFKDDCICRERGLCVLSKRTKIRASVVIPHRNFQRRSMSRERALRLLAILSLRILPEKVQQVIAFSLPTALAYSLDRPRVLIFGASRLLVHPLMVMEERLGSLAGRYTFLLALFAITKLPVAEVLLASREAVQLFAMHIYRQPSQGEWWSNQCQRGHHSCHPGNYYRHVQHGNKWRFSQC